MFYGLNLTNIGFFLKNCREIYSARQAVTMKLAHCGKYGNSCVGGEGALDDEFQRGKGRWAREYIKENEPWSVSESAHNRSTHKTMHVAIECIIPTVLLGAL